MRLYCTLGVLGLCGPQYVDQPDKIPLMVGFDGLLFPLITLLFTCPSH